MEKNIEMSQIKIPKDYSIERIEFYHDGRHFRLAYINWLRTDD